jgi:hypothetical protein
MEQTTPFFVGIAGARLNIAPMKNIEENNFEKYLWHK